MATEDYLLLLLSDSNLPSGGFIASSGLESYVQHGLLSSDDGPSKVTAILQFVQRSLHSYAALNAPFLASTHSAVASLRVGTATLNATALEIRRMDTLYEAMVLNHIARRASSAQGVALLTLYERAFATDGEEEQSCRNLVEQFRLDIRKGVASGHLVVGFSVLTASLGLSLAASQHLFLFLHARSLLSSAIRMNIIGPYVSHRLLLHDVRPIVDATLSASRAHRLAPATADDDPWPLAIDEDGPATTWPLGEILAARHDQLHSKIFNS